MGRFEDASLGFLHRFVARSVVQLDVLAILSESARNPDMLTEAMRDSLGERRLAVARRAIQKHARARIHGRPQLVEQFRFNADSFKGGRELFAPSGFGPNRLGLD